MVEAAKLGSVNMIWSLGRRTPRGALPVLTKAKLGERANPSNKSWDEKKKVNESCWIIVESNGDFFCDYEAGFKGHLCDHVIGMHYINKTGRIEESEQVRLLPLGSTRCASMPKGTGHNKVHCLTPSPQGAQGCSIGCVYGGAGRGSGPGVHLLSGGGA